MWISGRLLIAVAAAVVVLGPVPTAADGPFQFFAITPCRLVDTRNPAGPSGGPALAPGATRNFMVQGQCGVPSGAKAAALNAAAVSPTGRGHLRLFPSGISAPNVSTINFSGNDPAVANSAIVPLAASTPDLSVFSFLAGGTGSVHLVLDVTGYFQ